VTRILPVAVCVIAYCVIAVAAYWPVSPLASGRIMNCGCADAAQESWFLAWPAFALTHLHSLFYTNWIGFPAGVNLAANTSMPLLGLLASPVVAAAGPIAAYNLLLRLGFAVSATSAFYVLTRWGCRRPAAFVGGLVYGFSPFLVGEGLGHVFLVFAPIPPLLFLCLSELMWRQRRPPWQLGLAIGVLAAAQFYISAEILATTILLLLVAAAGVVLPRESDRQRVRYALTSLAYAGGVFLLLSGYAIWFFLAGTRHITGPSHSVASLDPYRADLLSAVIPTGSQLLAPFGLATVGNRLTGHDITETGAYIGIPLLILLSVIVVRYRKDVRIRFAAGMAAASYVLSMGSHLRVDGVETHVPLPFLLLQHVPVLQGADAGRFSLYTNFFLATLLALGLGHLGSERLPSWLRAWPAVARRPRAVWLAVCGACLVPLLPNFPYHEVPPRVPALFQDQAADQIAPGSVLLAYPYPYTPNVQAMLWSAVAGLRFRIIGGQAAIPGPGGKATSAPERLSPPTVEQLFLAGFYGGPARPAPPLDASTLAGLRRFLVTYRVDTVAVAPIGRNPALVVSYLARALERPPRLTGGVRVWFHARRLALAALRAAR
jgi:hypothetical protein